MKKEISANVDITHLHKWFAFKLYLTKEGARRNIIFKEDKSYLNPRHERSEAAAVPCPQVSTSSTACMSTGINSGFILLSSLCKHEKLHWLKSIDVQWGPLQKLGWVCPVPGSCTPVSRAVLALGIKSPTLLLIWILVHTQAHINTHLDLPGTAPVPYLSPSALSLRGT